MNLWKSYNELQDPDWLLYQDAGLAFPGLRCYFRFGADHAENHRIRRAPGPYGDLIKAAIQPGLEKKGYKVVLKEFSDYVQPNLALANNSIDANLFQHRLYLEKFSADKGLKLSPVISVPTAGLGLYSHKITAIDQLKKGDIVTLANDPTNLARALRFLAKQGLLTFKKDIDPTQASEKDIEQNPLGLVFKPLEAAQLPRTLDSATASVVNGNYAIAAGLSLSSALKLEVLDENIKNLVAVKPPISTSLRPGHQASDRVAGVPRCGQQSQEYLQGFPETGLAEGKSRQGAQISWGRASHFRCIQDD